MEPEVYDDLLDLNSGGQTYTDLLLSSVLGILEWVNELESNT